MYANIGARIRLIARILGIIGIAASVIAGLAICLSTGRHQSTQLRGMLVIAGGGCASLVLFLLLNALGKAFEKKQQEPRTRGC